MYCNTVHSFQESIAETSAYFEQGQKSGWLKPVVGKQFSMKEAADAHLEVIEHKGGSLGKIVLNIDHDN